MTANADRLYELLPTIYRQRDVEQGYPLRDLLRVIAEQVDLVEGDIRRLYDNWFIETCDDWAVPYIGDLIGYRPVHDAGVLGDGTDARSRERNRAIVPRAEVANTIAYRRRKGTLELLEDLARAVAGWPARAVEFGPLVRRNAPVSGYGVRRLPGDASVRDGDALDLLGGPFDPLAHTADIRRISSQRDQGRYNLPNVGLFVWRLRTFPLSRSRPFCLPRRTNCYTFSVLGNNAPLFTRAVPEDEEAIAGEPNVPAPIRRRAFERNKEAYYGKGRSLCIHEDGRQIPADQIIVADLSDWHYQPEGDRIAVDPVLGRMMVADRRRPRDFQVSYHYGFSAATGGGEYDRRLSSNPLGVSLFRQGHLLDGGKEILVAIRDAANILPDPTDTNDQPIQPRDLVAPRLYALASAELLAAIAGWDGETPDAALHTVLRSGLNRVIQGGLLDEQERIDRVVLTDPEAIALRVSNPGGAELVRFNRLLVEAAFPATVARSFKIYYVTSQTSGRQALQPLNAALDAWREDRPRSAVIEIADSGRYTEPVGVQLEAYQSLEIRAGEGYRPVIELPETNADVDDMIVECGAASRLVLDGLLIARRGVRIYGEPAEVIIRHTTLVPGWALEDNCKPTDGDEPSLTISDAPAEEESNGRYVAHQQPPARILVQRSIIGTIHVERDQVGKDPLEIAIEDSILDATGATIDALTDPSRECCAHAIVTVLHSTVFGAVRTHAIALAENSIFYGEVCVGRRQLGCMRFCSVQPGSRTPRRYRCQPDVAEQQAVEQLPAAASEAARDQARRIATERVRPQFSSMRYGEPAYAQLALTCDEAIIRGADDESEMGAFHHLYQPQRTANLRARLEEYTPAGMDGGIIFVN